MKDLLYYYDKATFKQYEFGEIQTGFNMSLVIDGTKDSCKANVYSYIEKEITPNTIVWHKATNTWWIVANDKTSRYENENGYFYTHELQLEGAIELLNARDLTDSGFNANRYNIDQFINRLFAHSNFELPITINYNANISSDKNIDYIKTFENYTLLSALREFLDGYNCVAKLSFEKTTQDNDIIINNAVISIVSKTGNANVLPRNADDVFNDIREIRNTNKSNYGTSVISNAENVVSTKTKTYPSVGGIKLASNNGMAVTGQNAILLLPSNVFKANYIDICWSRVPYGYVTWSGNTSTVHYLGYFDASNPESIQNAYDTYIETLEQEDIDTSSVSIEQFTKYACRIYYCDNYDAVNNNFISEYPIQTANIHNPNHGNVQYVLTSKELKETNTYTQRAICFERGKNYLSGFDAFSGGSGGNSLELTSITTSTIYKLIGTNDRLVAFVGAISVNGNQISATYPSIDIKYASFIVNYIPMSDIKIKMDNYGDTIDSVLYNQNGKLNDSNSLSKVLLSYSKEIESDTITRYGTYYGGYVNDLGFQNGGLPSVGDLILVENDYYVINNISIDFSPNESFGWLVDSIGYYMTAEVSLSKKVATKSMLTSPNTNIRDYGIPQNNNVKRKQLYRDFFEFDYTIDDNSDDNWYQPIGNIIVLGNMASEYKEHIALIHTHFENNVNGNKDYYYQLETTTYFLKKSIYEIVDFKDNNIIGYGYQNIWSGFDISKILNGIDSLVDLYTIPISYVDNLGEIKGIRIKLAKVDNIKDSYDAYLSTTQYSGSDVSIYNASVFIPSEIFTYITSGKYDILITEQEYYKDALEVPVFEYSAQVDDSDNVLVGENIFDRGNNDVAYLYSYIITQDNNYDDNNYMNLSNELPPVVVNAQNQATHSYAVQFDYTHINDSEPYFTLKLYDREVVDLNTNTVSTDNEINLSEWFEQGYTLLIIRNNLTKDDLYTNVIGELVFNSVQDSLPTAQASYQYKYVIYSSNYYLCELDSANGDLATTSVDNYADFPSASSQANKYRAGYVVSYTYPSNDYKPLVVANVYEATTTLPNTYSASQYSGKYIVGWTYNNVRELLNTSSTNNYNNYIGQYPTSSQVGKYVFTRKTEYNYPTTYKTIWNTSKYYVSSGNYPSNATAGSNIAVKQDVGDDYPHIGSDYSNYGVRITPIISGTANPQYINYQLWVNNSFIGSYSYNQSCDITQTQLRDLFTGYKYNNFIRVINTGSSGGPITVRFKVEVINTVSSQVVDTSYYVVTETSTFQVNPNSDISINNEDYSSVISQICKPSDGQWWWFTLDNYGTWVKDESNPIQNGQMCRYRTTNTYYTWSSYDSDYAQYIPTTYYTWHLFYATSTSQVWTLSDSGITNYKYRYGSTYYTWNTSTHELDVYNQPSQRVYYNYYSNGSSWQQSTQPSVNDYYWVGSNINTDATWYQWNGTGFTQNGQTIENINYYLYFSNGSSWTSSALNQMDHYLFDNNNYVWNGTSAWTKDSTYSWDNKGSASGLSFTYGNQVYTYDAIGNKLDLVGSSKTIRTQDLMFVFRNLQNAVIENNSLKVFVNHYKLK